MMIRIRYLYSWLLYAILLAIVGVLLSYSLMSRAIARFTICYKQGEWEIVPAQCDSSIICPGEDLFYEVSWLMFNLGTIRLRSFESTIRDGEITHTAAAFINSYDDIPFVDIHAIDYSDMDTLFYSKGFHSLEKRDEIWLSERSYYDFPRHVVVIEKTWQKDPKSKPMQLQEYDTIRVNQDRYQDGLSLLYFARANARRDQTISVSTLVYGKIGATHFHFVVGRGREEIDAFDYPLRVVVMEGRADFRGIYGMTGDFKGWFTDDVAAIPIKAELQVLLGSIKIELKHWKREGWQPPIEVE